MPSTSQTRAGYRRALPALVGVILVLASLGVSPSRAAVVADSGLSAEWRASAAWAADSRTRQTRACRSGGDYGRDNGSGYYGGYGLSARQWTRFGGDAFGDDAAAADRRSQNLVAWRLYEQLGWRALRCLQSDWMDVVYRSAPKTSISKMLLPGSHDAGSSRIETAPPCDVQTISAASWLEPLIGANPCAVAAMAKAQGQNLGAQLRAGSRYLDMRVGVPLSQQIASTGQPVTPAGDPTEVPLVLHHNIVSQRLTRGLRQVQRFVAKHPREQVVLDFQHLDFTGDQYVLDYYKNALGRLLHEYAPGATNSVCRTSWSKNKVPTADSRLGTGVGIGELWEVERSILVLFPDGEMPSYDCYRNRDAVLISLWPNTEDPQTSLSDNLSWLNQREAKLSGASACRDSQGQWCQIYISQLQLSMQIAAQAGCVANTTAMCSLEYYAGLVNNGIANKLMRWRFKRDLPVNIAMIDFMTDTDPDLPDALLRGNWRIADGNM